MDMCNYIKDMGKQLGSDPMPPKDSLRDTLKFLVEKLVTCPAGLDPEGLELRLQADLTQ